MGTTPDFGIPELSQGQANPDITHNEALVMIQALLNGVLDKDLTAPPGSPAEGDAYLINTAAPTGAWASHGFQVAIYWGGSWRFVPGRDDSGTIISMGTRQEGLRVWVRDENLLYIFTNTTGSPSAWHWTAVAPAQIATLLYLKTAAKTVATLTAAATAGAGARDFVTDANATTFASIVAAGGSNGVPVYSDGTNWRIG